MRILADVPDHEPVLAWTRQQGVVTRKQAVAVLGDAEVRRRLAAGQWQIVTMGIYRTGSGEILDHHRRAAAVLHGGDRAQLAGAHACAALGVRDVPTRSSIDVLTPASRRPSDRDFVVVHPTVRLPDPVVLGARPGGLPVSPLPRAAVDAARWSSDLRQARAVLCEVVQQGRVGLGDLEAELGSGPSAGSALPRRVLAELRAGVRSIAEAEARDLVLSSSILPTPLLNVVLVDSDGRFVARPDGLFWQSGTAYEVNSRRHHSSRDDWEATMERQVRMESLGLRMVPFSPAQLRREPATLLLRLEAVHREGLRTGPPRHVRVRAMADGSPPPPDLLGGGRPRTPRS